jgi:hypothetical protein
MVSFDSGIYRYNYKDVQKAWLNLTSVLGHELGVRRSSFAHHTECEGGPRSPFSEPEQENDHYADSPSV